MLELALLLAGLGSGVNDELTAAVSLIRVPNGVLEFTFTVTTKFAVAAAFRVAMVQVIAPVPPTAGVVHDQPAGVGSETKVVLAGVVPENVTVVAMPGPPLVTTCV